MLKHIKKSGSSAIVVESAGGIDEELKAATYVQNSFSPVSSISP